MCLPCNNFDYEQLLALVVVLGTLGCWLCSYGQLVVAHFHESLLWNNSDKMQSLGFSKPCFLCHIFCRIWCNTESLMCSTVLESSSFSFLLLLFVFYWGLPFHRWAPLQRRLCLFYMNSLLTLLTTNHTERGVRE